MPGREDLVMAERWLSVEQISAHLGVSTDAVYKWIYRKKMPAHKVGRLWKFLTSEVDLWVKAGRAAKDVTADEPGKNAKRPPGH